MIDTTDLTALILAGGAGQRLQGQDKGWLTLNDKPLVEHVMQRLAPQVGRVIISANRNLTRYATLGVPVLSDEAFITQQIGRFADAQAFQAPYQGPLLAIAGALLQLQKTQWLVCVPCDTPFIAADYVQRLSSATSSANAVYAKTAQHNHYLCGLFSACLAEDLLTYLVTGQRAAKHWLQSVNAQAVDFSDCEHCFENINTEQDMLRAKQMASS